MHQHITNRLYEFVPINRLSWASSNCIFTMAVYWVYISLLTHWFSCFSDKKKKKNECNEPHTQTKTKKAQIIQCFSSHQTLNINTGTCKLQVVHEKKWYSLKEKRQPVSLKNPSLKPSSSKQLQLDFLIRRFSLDVSGGKI